MRILTVTHYQTPHLGGIELTGAALHTRYQRLGHESVWLSSDLPHAQPSGGQVRVAASDLPFRTTGVAYPWGPSASVACAADRWCDVVNPHDCLYPGTLLALHWARRLGKPLVLTQHAGPWPFYRSAALRGVQLAAYHSLGLAVHRRVRQAVFISRAVQEWFGARVATRGRRASSPTASTARSSASATRRRGAPRASGSGCRPTAASRSSSGAFSS
jgi:glycosyltransferase involved in cell wall biosynthesis